MNKRVLFIQLSIIVLVFQHANAYELSTHGLLTDKAYERSNLGVDTALFDQLGVNATNLKVFGESYYDVSGNEIGSRSQNDFEKQRMPSKGLGFLTVKGWLMRGAIREDDVPVFFGKNPQDDPYGQIFRVANHFYDPRNDRPLTIIGIPLGKKAPDWAIGAKDVFDDENDANTNRRNHFTVFDARESLFRALTGMDKGGSTAIGAGGSTPGTAADKEAVRKAYWATTFRALGDLIHLVQDMAQPQHTRNDAHAGSGMTNTVVSAVNGDFV